MKSDAKELAARYAQALFDSATDKRKSEDDLESLLVLLEACPDLKTLTWSPLFSRAQQESILLALANKSQFQEKTRAFLGVLARNRRLDLLPLIAESYRQLHARLRHETQVHVRAARQLSRDQQHRLKEALAAYIEKNLGQSKTPDQIKLSLDTAPELIGGFVVKIGSLQIDFSLQRQLRRLETRLLEEGMT